MATIRKFYLVPEIRNFPLVDVVSLVFKTTPDRNRLQKLLQKFPQANVLFCGSDTKRRPVLIVIPKYHNDCSELPRFITDFVESGHIIEVTYLAEISSKPSVRTG
jgi:hypothetical protein